MTVGKSGSRMTATVNPIEIPNIQRYHFEISLSGSNCNKYPAKQHARKVAARLGVTTGLIYLEGQPTVLVEDSDQPVPFRQRRYFYYLSGVDEPDCRLTYDIKSDTLTLYLPSYDLRHVIYNGQGLTPEDALQKYDIDQARYIDSLSSEIASWVQRHDLNSDIFVLHASQTPPSTNGARIDATRLQPVMDALRAIKDPYEIDMIRKANIVSGLAHTEVLRHIGKMSNEAEIAGLFLNVCTAHGAPKQAYEIIAASGENAAVLHYIKNNQPFKNRQLVCLDAGAEFNCYASDVTRTFPLNPNGEWPSPEARNIYRAVERMQEECIKRIKPGVRFAHLHVLAHRIAVEELLKLGILKGGTVEELLASGVSTSFFLHGLGHHIGLEVHDVSEKPIMAQDDGEVPSVLAPTMVRSPCTLSAAPLEPGMIVTVEPGIYFSSAALRSAKTLPIAQYISFDVVERYLPVGGVRIEDDILVTPDGYENLTTAPKGERALEIIRNSH
ncbi:hypothetical protein VTN31DRAFT_1121 [Thermomyces dupontii]|uniref:uncharacterized protein n=1 Tax=Talaromyces thermophilus TaxID=28565 RepID=UPI003743C043